MRERSLVDDLLSDGHELPSLLIEGGRIKALNGPARALLGSAASVGAEVTTAFDPVSGEKLRRALSTSRPGEWELQVARGAELEPLNAHFLLLPVGGRGQLLVLATSGSPYSATSSARFIEMNNLLANLARELSRSSAALIAAHQRLAELSALRDQFMSTLSHDLKGPLSAIRLAASLIAKREGAAAPRVLHQARLIERNVDRLVSLADSVLAAASLGGQSALDRRPVSLVEIAREVVDALEPIATNADVQLCLSGEHSGTVIGDAVRLFQVLENLVGNAIRYSPAGGQVTVRVEGEADAVRCSVCDQGPGVPPEARSRIFDAYRKVGDKPGAAGLGLYIARQIVALHGGRLWVEDGAPGARFCFTVPAADGGT